jgi:ATP-dependent Clp protease ATP-binding subunit ClpA
MFERFTPRARSVIVEAEQQALKYSNSSIGTEHLLLGLLSLDSGVGKYVLRSFDVSIAELTSRIEQYIAPDATKAKGHLPFSPQSQKVLELSLRESLALEHTHVGTEHLLLGLLREGKGIAAKSLSDSGIYIDRLRDEVIRITSDAELNYLAKSDTPVDKSAPYDGAQAVIWLESLGELLKQGLLNEDEFNELKAPLVKYIRNSIEGSTDGTL